MIRLDFETYSEAGFVWDEAAQKWKAPRGAMKKGLPVVGSAAYVEHPTFEVLTMSYDIGFGVQRWRPGQPAPVPLLMAVQRGELVSGWNSGGFEFKVWNKHCAPKYGWPPLQLEQLRDTMAQARAHAQVLYKQAVQLFKVGARKSEKFFFIIMDKLKRLFVVKNHPRLILAMVRGLNTA